MPSLTSTSTSVFGRFTGKRQVAANEQAVEGGRLTPPLEGTLAREKTRLGNGTGHRRESSVLSLTSVTELGQNVKRSVSLRSHRSNPSNTSHTFGHKARSSSSAIHFSPTLTTSPLEDQDDEPHVFPPSTTTSPPRSRGKLSLSARSLSSKFSAQSLSTFSQPESLDSTLERPTTAVEIRKIPSSSSMLAPPPAAPKRAPPDRPLAPPPAIPPDPANSSNGQHGLHMQATATPVPHSSNHDPKAVYRQIHDTSAKRMATIEYLRKVHEGNLFYFSTVHYTPVSLQSIPSMHPLKLGRRATNYFVLGYSLPALLDLNSSNPLEYLRALTSLLQEFETYQTLMGVDSSGNSLSRGRVGNMFKIGNKSKSRRTSTTTDSISIPPSDMLSLPRSASEAMSPMEVATPSPVSPSGHDFQHLVTPHLPFDPDFITIYSTLCDTIIDTYAKLMDLVSSPDVCTPAVSDAFAKVDKTIRKILIANVLREFEESARANVKGEMAGLGKLVLGGLM